VSGIDERIPDERRIGLTHLAAKKSYGERRHQGRRPSWSAVDVELTRRIWT
jgi:hypothetical protein